MRPSAPVVGSRSVSLFPADVELDETVIGYVVENREHGGGADGGELGEDKDSSVLLVDVRMIQMTYPVHHPLVHTCCHGGSVSFEAESRANNHWLQHQWRATVVVTLWIQVSTIGTNLVRGLFGSKADAKQPLPDMVIISSERAYIRKNPRYSIMRANAEVI